MVQSEATRLTRHALAYGAVFLLTLVGSWLFSAPGSSVATVLKGFGAVAALMALVYAPRALWATAMGGPERDAIAATQGVSRQHFYKGTGIALDPQKRELHLISARVYRCYPLDQVRTWQRRLQSGGGVYGGGWAGVAANVDNLARNAANSGLFVEVRDVDHPSWRIAFPPRTIERDLARWMEVLQQAVNEAPVSQPTGSPDSG